MGNATGAGSILSSLGNIRLSAGRDLVIDDGSALATGPDSSGDLAASAGRNFTLQATTTAGANITNGAGSDVILTTGAGGTFTLNSGAGGQIASGGGDITISADAMNINDPIDAQGPDTTGIVTLQQAMGGTGSMPRNIDLGGGTTVGDLNLADTQLGLITADVLRIGRTDNPGSITITAPVTTHAGFSTLSLLTGEGMSETGSGAITVTSLAAEAAGLSDLSTNPSAVSNLAASSSGDDFFLVDSLSLTVGSVDDLEGITTKGGAISINAPSIQVSQPINTTGGAGAGLVVTGSNVSPQAPNAIYVAAPGSAGNILLNDADERFVKALYVDFLGRSGSLLELDGWVSALPSLGRAGVVNGIMRSSEALTRVVDALYVRFLGRAAGGAEEMGWVDALHSGALNEEQVIAGLLASPEFANRADTLFPKDPPDTAFVEALYSLLLNRPADAGLAGWVNALASLGRDGVAKAFEDSLEFRGGAVRTFYGDPTLTPFPYQPFFVNLLHRSAAPSADEVSGWVNQGLDLLSIEGALASSDEFYQNSLV
jgi:hypothetical protein